MQGAVTLSIGLPICAFLLGLIIGSRRERASAAFVFAYLVFSLEVTAWLVFVIVHFAVKYW